MIYFCKILDDEYPDSSEFAISKDPDFSDLANEYPKPRYRILDLTPEQFAFEYFDAEDATYAVI